MANLSNDIREWCLEVKDTDLVIFEEYKKTISRSEESDSDEDENSPQFEEDEGFPIKLKEMMMYHSSFGNLVPPELSDPSKHFKLWTIYSKIPLTIKILSNIEKASGIETIEAITRYRARIGICPLFVDNQVISSVKKIIEESLISDIKSLSKN